MKAAATAFTVSERTTRKWLLRFRDRTAPVIEEEVDRLRRQRLTCRQIAQQTGINCATVQRILARRLPFRSSPWVAIDSPAGSTLPIAFRPRSLGAKNTLQFPLDITAGGLSRQAWRDKIWVGLVASLDGPAKDRADSFCGYYDRVGTDSIRVLTTSTRDRDIRTLIACLSLSFRRAGRTLPQMVALEA
jgi:hypothetical protein